MADWSRLRRSHSPAPWPPARHPQGRRELYPEASQGRAGSRGVAGRAVEALLLVVELSGPTMMARIGVMCALNRNVVRVFNPDRKDTHWGKRKLKRDQ